ncbi:MAG: hypothetical protein ABIV06_05465 [Thermoanaerobaculia bacterium]
MAHESARAGRASRYHSSGSERAGSGRAAPAADYAAFDDDFDDFDDLDDLDDLDESGLRDSLRHRRVYGGQGGDSLSSMADDLIDDLIPPQVDWRQIVLRHPWPALLLAGLSGYLLGRSQGKTLVRALSALAVARVESEVLGRIEDELD